MEDRILEYLAYSKEIKKISENTVASYRLDLTRFAEYLKENQIKSYDKVTELHVNSYILHMEKLEFSNATIARTIVSLRSFMLFLVKKQYITTDPMERIKAPKVAKKQPVIISEQQMDQLLALPSCYTAKGVRDKAMLELVYATGIKPSELIELTIHDINLVHNIVICRNSKKERLIPLTTTASEALRTYMKERINQSLEEETEILFLNRNGLPLSRQGFWKIIKSYAEEAGIDNITPQILRNSFAAHLIRHGANITAVGEMLGYEDKSMASIYTTSESIRVREEYMKAHPREQKGEKE